MTVWSKGLDPFRSNSSQSFEFMDCVMVFIWLRLKYAKQVNNTNGFLKPIRLRFFFFFSPIQVLKISPKGGARFALTL